MNSPSRGPDFGPVRQLGYVVDDLGRAVEAWTRRLGVGPWTLIRNIPLHCHYFGKPSEPSIDIALAYRGEVQIELIRQTNEAPSPYLPFQRRGDYGLHHTAFLSARIDQDVARAEAAGLHLVCDIRMPTGGRYVYFEAPVPGERGFIELLEATPQMLGMFERGIAAAAAWDGSGEPLDLEFAALAGARA